MPTALTDMPTTVLEKQAVTFSTILKILAVVGVVFVLTMVWLILVRGWQTRFLLSVTPVMAVIAVSAPTMSRLAAIKLELERRLHAQ
jgi:hypothetical protein